MKKKSTEIKAKKTKCFDFTKASLEELVAVIRYGIPDGYHLSKCLNQKEAIELAWKECKRRSEGDIRRMIVSFGEIQLLLTVSKLPKIEEDDLLTLLTLGPEVARFAMSNIRLRRQTLSPQFWEKVRNQLLVINPVVREDVRALLPKKSAA